MAARILIIDDNQAILNYLRIFLLQSGCGCIVQTLQDSTKAYDTLQNEKFDILLLDMDMPGVNGIDILNFIRQNNISITTVVITGVEDIDLAISAMKLGTLDYMLKPIDENKLLEVINNIIERININSGDRTKGIFSYENLKYKEAFSELITQDERMIKIFHFVGKFANTDNSILIWGESGTGKELIAAAIHKISSRRDKKFIAINAGLLAHELFASEFFGHDRGAFTGAVKDKKGLIEEANGGTLFLDEIGELDLLTQVKLLRVLQEQQFYKLGSTKNIKVDVRVIAATNKNLFEEITKGNFRKDLFFRLNINSIELPPLRERKGDIELLARHFLQEFDRKYNKNIKKISPSVINLLNSYSFPGNVRELMNIINSAIIVESGTELRKQSLPNYFWESCGTAASDKEASAHITTTQAYHEQEHIKDREIEKPPSTLDEIENEYIKKVLEMTHNNRTKASGILGISRVSLIARIKKYGL